MHLRKKLAVCCVYMLILIFMLYLHGYEFVCYIKLESCLCLFIPINHANGPLEVHIDFRIL